MNYIVLSREEKFHDVDHTQTKSNCLILAIERQALNNAMYETERKKIVILYEKMSVL